MRLLAVVAIGCAAFASARAGAHESNAYTYDAVAPLMDAYEACWKESQLNGTGLDCLAMVAPRLRANNGGKPLSRQGMAYAGKMLDNVMFRRWYDSYASKGEWPKGFPDAENISNACVEDRSPHAAIDCVNKATSPYLVRAWQHFNNDTPQIISWLFKTSATCLSKRLEENDLIVAQSECLVFAKDQVGSLSYQNAIDVAGVYYRIGFDWLKESKINLVANDADAAKALCRKSEELDREKARCMLTRTARVLKLAVASAKERNNISELKEKFK